MGACPVPKGVIPAEAGIHAAFVYSEAFGHSDATFCIAFVYNEVFAYSIAFNCSATCPPKPPSLCFIHA
jgi:hypothetical protein